MADLTWIADWTYSGQQTDKLIATYTTGAKKVKIESITLPLGTGNARYNTPDDITGNGESIDTYLKINDLYESIHCEIIKQVGHSTIDNISYYPTQSDLENYTFEFSDSIQIDPNTTINISIWVPSSTSTTTGNVLCIGTSGSISYTEVQDEYTFKFYSNYGSSHLVNTVETCGYAITIPGYPSTEDKKSYTLTYDATGGSISPSSKKYECNLNGWNTKQDGSGASYNVGQSYTLDDDLGYTEISLYAQWGNPKISTLPTPTRIDGTFANWVYGASKDYQIVKTTDIIEANTTIYATWNFTVFRLYSGSQWVKCDPRKDIKYIWRYNASEKKWKLIRPYYEYTKNGWESTEGRYS